MLIVSKVRHAWNDMSLDKNPKVRMALVDAFEELCVRSAEAAVCRSCCLARSCVGPRINQEAALFAVYIVSIILRQRFRVMHVRDSQICLVLSVMSSVSVAVFSASHDRKIQSSVGLKG